jgi:hypothetical protein
MERKEEMQIEFLYQALTEARETIQFVDTKAGTVILLVGGLLAFMGAIHARIDTLLLQILATIMLAALVLAAICAIWALNPRVNAENLIDSKGVTLAPLYFVRSVASPARWRNWLPFTSANRLEMSVADYLRHLDTLDAEGLRRQLVYELLKVSFIREEKIHQVGWAVRFIQVAGGFLTLLVLSLYIFSKGA